MSKKSTGFAQKILGALKGNNKKLDFDFSGGDDEPSKDGFTHNHCFVFYGLNNQAFSGIEEQVHDNAGPDRLSLLTSQAGIFMTAMCEQGAGSAKVKELVGDNDAFTDYVTSRFEQYTDKYKSELTLGTNMDIGNEFLHFLEKEKHLIVQNMRIALKKWALSDFFRKEECLGAVFVFVKSSKEFDKNDRSSEKQDGMNLPVVAAEGFLRTCFFELEDCINVNFTEMEEVTRDSEQEDGGWALDKIEEMGVEMSGMHMVTAGEPIHNVNYYDQNNYRWHVDAIGRAVNLMRIEDNEDAMDYEVTH